MRDRRKHKKVWLLFFLFSIFLGQESILTQVLCFKVNGSVDFELALFTLDCPCRDCHMEESHRTEETSCWIAGHISKCEDIPLGNLWRVHNENNSAFPVKHSSGDIILSEDRESVLEFSGDFPHGVPLSKFICQSFNESIGAVLRC